MSSYQNAMRDDAWWYRKPITRYVDEPYKIESMNDFYIYDKGDDEFHLWSMIIIIQRAQLQHILFGLFHRCGYYPNAAALLDWADLQEGFNELSQEKVNPLHFHFCA